jgi:hypothetical protein
MPRTWLCGSILSVLGDSKDRSTLRWVTDLRVSRRNVFHHAGGSPVEDRKQVHYTENQGYSFEQNYGMASSTSVGYADDASVLGGSDPAGVAPCSRRCGRNWAASACCGSDGDLFYDYALESMCQLFEVLYGFKKSAPRDARFLVISSHVLCDLVPSNQGISPNGGQLRLQHETRLPSTRQLVTSHRKSPCKRWQWLVGTLTELSATMVV